MPTNRNHTASTTEETDVVEAEETASPAPEMATERKPAKPTVVERPADADPDWEDDDLVRITFGFGRNDDNSQQFWVDDIRFAKNRISAGGVNYTRARALQKRYPKIVKIHPLDATESDIARRCGIAPVKPDKVAAMLIATQEIDAVLAAMSPEQRAYLARKFGEAAALDRASSGHDILTSQTGRAR